MGATHSACPACGSKLGLPHNGSTIVCPTCGAESNPSKLPRERQDDSLVGDEVGVSVKPWPRPEGAEELLAELDEKIGELASDIEALRSREQAAPLELGCALFGIFGVIILVLALFATVGRAYFGGVIFYLVLVTAILAGVYRLAPKIISRAELRGIGRRRAEMESTLNRLRTERERLDRLESDSSRRLES